MDLTRLINGAARILSAEELCLPPWEIVARIPDILRRLLRGLTADYRLDGDVAIHDEAVVEPAAVIKGPALVSRGCFIAAGAYLRGGVFLDDEVAVGASCEVKGTIVFRRSRIAHLNFVGDSILGEDVNVEAGAIVANHWNERRDKRIRVVIDGTVHETGATKFGALLGDRSRIGANAVTSPGTILEPDSIVHRLQLIDQVAAFEKSVSG